MKIIQNVALGFIPNPKNIEGKGHLVIVKRQKEQQKASIPFPNPLSFYHYRLERLTLDS